MGGGSEVIYKKVYTKTNKPTNHKLFKNYTKHFQYLDWCEIGVSESDGMEGRKVQFVFTLKTKK